MAEEGQVIAVHTTQAWDEQLKKGNENKKLLVVDFTATWCGPCRLIAPILAELARKTPEVTFLKVDVDELKSVAEDWAVEAMPTFMFLKEGKIVDKVVGAKKDELQLKVTKHAATAAPAAAAADTAAAAADTAADTAAAAAAAAADTAAAAAATASA